MDNKKVGVIFIAVFALAIIIFLVLSGGENDVPNDYSAEANNEQTHENANEPEADEPEQEQEQESELGSEPTEGYVIIGGESFSIELDELDLRSRNLQNEDIVSLRYMVNLVSLNLSNNQISDLTPMSELVNLTYLNVDNNQVSDISPISNLTGLTGLDLCSNQISDLSLLSDFVNLNFLCLGNNQINDITPLSGLTDLAWLGLWENQISDITLLSNHVNLNTLYLGGNQISDITPLSGLDLYTVGLQGNLIDDWSSVEHLHIVWGRPTVPGQVIYTLSEDVIIQGHEIGTSGNARLVFSRDDLWTPFLMQSGSPEYTIVEGPYGNAIVVGVRNSSWYALDLPLAMNGFVDFESNEYDIVVRGRNISDFAIEMALAAADGPWNWIYSEDVAPGEEFTISGVLNYDVLDETAGGIDQFLLRGLRLQTGCTQPFVIYNVTVTRTR